jgi:uncharacterized protein involved in exopolysaccharide biosynthesis
MRNSSVALQENFPLRPIQPIQDNGSLRPIVEAAFRYHRLWWMVVVGVVLLTLAYVTVAPRQYRSDMDILVQNKRGDDQITPDRVSGEMMVNGVTEEQINSEIQILTSRELANLVVDPQWDNHAHQTSLTPAQLKAHDKAVIYFEKHLTVSLVRKSNIIHASYVSSNPKTATDTLNRLLAVFLEKQRDIAQPPGTANFFAAQAADYKKQLDQAQQQLADFQQKQNIVSLSDTEQALDRNINEAQTELRTTDAQLAELTKQIGTRTRQLHSIPTRQMTQVRTIPNDYSVERLNTMLADLQNQRTALLTKFTPKDRLVQQIDQQIADTRTNLKKAESMTSQEHDSDINPVWQSVTGSIIQDETQREALKAKHTALTQQIAGLQGQLGAVEGSTVSFTTLRQKVSDLQNNYQLYTQKADEAQIADAMNANRLLNVAVAQSPTFSVTAFHPRPTLDMILGAFTAMFLASFLVFFAEMGRSTFASAAEVEKLTQCPVLATVPLNRVLAGKRTERLGDFAPVFIGMTTSPKATNERRAGVPSLIRYRKEPQVL